MTPRTQPLGPDALPRSRRDPGYTFQADDDDDCDDARDAEEDPEDDDDDEDEAHHPHFDVDGALIALPATPLPVLLGAQARALATGIEGFEDWRVDDDLGDREHGPEGYDDDGEWNHDVQEDLPELIYTEGCDDDSVEITPCISLPRCSNRLPNAPSANGSGTGGEVDAVRVMLLGVSDSGRPSVGIDLGYACTQQHNQAGSTNSSTNSGSTAVSQSETSSNDHSLSSSPNSMSHRVSDPPEVSSPGADIGRSSSHNDSVHTTSHLTPSSVRSSATSLRPSRPASPFVFQPPRTPSKMVNTPTRRSFVFSEWASNNKQTFVFEGSTREGDEAEQRRGPCKFVPTKSLTLAVQDADFVSQVLGELPGVDTKDPRIMAMLTKIRDSKLAGSRPQTPKVSDIIHKSSISPIRPTMPKRPPSSSSMLGRTSTGSTGSSSEIIASISSQEGNEKH